MVLEGTKPFWMRVLKRVAMFAASSAVLLAATLSRESAYGKDDPFRHSLAFAALVDENSAVIPDGLESMRMQIKTRQFSGFAIFNFAQDREHVVFYEGRQTSSLYRAGDVMYSQIPSGGWMKVNLKQFSALAPSPHPRRGAKRTSAAWDVRVLPDRMVNGIRMGALSYEVRTRDIDPTYVGPETATVTCLYEKVKREPVICSAPNLLRVTLDRYDDRRNAIVIPNEVLRATPFTPAGFVH